MAKRLSELNSMRGRFSKNHIRRFFYQPNALVVVLSLAIASCMARPVAGPDKQIGGTVAGALNGAGAGGVTGFHLTAGTGAGVAVGAGVGAVAGLVKGAAQDQVESQELKLQKEMAEQQRLAWVHQVLSDHYRKRLALHPSRDIFPADLFFFGDNITLKPEAKDLINELARLNKERMPWSRLVVAVYAKALGHESEYGKHLTERRAKEITDYFVRGGIEGRRIETRAVLLDEPLVIDPDDKPGRYNQAIEIIALDR